MGVFHSPTRTPLRSPTNVTQYSLSGLTMTSTNCRSKSICAGFETGAYGPARRRAWAHSLCGPGPSLEWTDYWAGCRGSTRPRHDSGRSRASRMRADRSWTDLGVDEPERNGVDRRRRVEDAPDPPETHGPSVAAGAVPRRTEPNRTDPSHSHRPPHRPCVTGHRSAAGETAPWTYRCA
jgi:hypothetical protein